MSRRSIRATGKRRPGRAISCCGPVVVSSGRPATASRSLRERCTVVAAVAPGISLVPPTVGREFFRYWARQARRWIFPLEVSGSFRAATSTISCAWMKCSAATRSRIAATISSRCSWLVLPRGSSWIITSRSSSWTSTEKVAERVAASSGWDPPHVASTSCGYMFLPRMIIRSLIRPVTISSSPRNAPRSPVRRYGPVPSAVEARNACSVGPAARKYPAATLAPRIQISPTRASGSGCLVSGSTIVTATSSPMRPDPTSASIPPGSTGGRTHPSSRSDLLT